MPASIVRCKPALAIKLEAQRHPDFAPADQLEILRGGGIVAVLRDEQPLGIVRAKIAKLKLDTIDDQIARDFDEFELESETAGPVFQLIARLAF